MSRVCLERVGVPVCGACLNVCAGVWVHSHVWGGTLTQKCCAKQSSPSSCPLLLPSYRRLEGRRCGKVGGRKLAREDGREGFQHPHQSLKQTFEDKCRKPSPGRLCMSFRIISGIKTRGVYWVRCQNEQSNKGWYKIIHERTKLVAEILVCIQFRKRLENY